jgi:hypothetical protein
MVAHYRLKLYGVTKSVERQYSAGGQRRIRRSRAARMVLIAAPATARLSASRRANNGLVGLNPPAVSAWAGLCRLLWRRGVPLC